MKKALYFILIFTLVLVSVVTIVGYLGSSIWFFDIFSHFNLQYFIVLIIGSLILLLKKRKICLFFLPFIVLIGMDIVPLYFGGAKDIGNSKTTKVICMNVLSSNKEYELMESFINDESPDILVLQELNELLKVKLHPVLSEYQYKLVLPREDNFGIAIFSKINLTSSQVVHIGKSELPSIAASFNLGKSNITLLATHPLPPVGKEYFDSRNDQLRALSNFVKSTPGEMILVGDLNCSSFSKHFKSFIISSGLIDSRKGFGLLPTWPTWFGLAKTTIDHCLVTNGLAVKSRRVGKFIGSDHLPIIVEFGIK